MLTLSSTAMRRRSRRSLTAALSTLAAAFATAALGAEAGLSLEAAVQMATQRSSLIPAAELQAQAAREMAVAAGQRPDPVLKAGINNLPIDGADRFTLTRDFMTMRAVGVMQEITRPSKLGARSARYEREADAAQAARTLALTSLRRDAAMAWLDRHFQERMREQLLAQRAEAALQIEAADAAYRGGKGAQGDALAARAAVALIDDRLRQNERQIATAITRLARWVGPEANGALAAPPDLRSTRLGTAGIETDLAHHPEIAMLAAQEEVARAEAGIAQSNKRADWSVELMLSQRGPAYSNMVSLTVSIPLQIDAGQRQDRDVAARLALAEQMRARREDAMREHRAETSAWLQEWQGNRERLAHYDETLLPLAAERTRAALTAYRGGTGALAAVLEARRSEIELRMDRLRLEMETAGRWAQLEYLLPPVHEAPARTTSPMEPRP